MAADDRQATKKQTTRKRPARKDADNEESAKKPPQKAVKKAAKKTAKKTGGRSGSRQEGRSAPRAGSSRRPTPLELARSAGEQLAELTGRQPESTTGIERTDDGWRIELEVVETRRIPDSADILAIYEVQVDEDGELISYRRVRRYPRGRTDPVDGGG